jgi:hypothetical protein
MKKVIRLTEQDLERMVRRIIKESDKDTGEEPRKTKYDESPYADEEHPLRKVKYDESMYGREEDFMDEDGEFDDEEVPIGVDNLESQGTSGLVLLFSPLESDMVKDWNNDKQIQRFVEEERLFLNELSYDKWEIYGIEGVRQVRNYIMKNYSW